jgi:SAM-dependent methyltransferase
VSARLHDPLANARLTGYGRPGFAARYDAYRPRPPAALVDLLLQLAGSERPALVVDLGCGTGLSTTPWAERAQEVVGIEPLDEMRQVADSRHRPSNVRYQAGVAQTTGLPAGAADIVTCAQSLHHMEPEGTLTEVERILRPGGVFAAYDYDWPPIVHREAEEAFFAFMERMTALRRRHGITSDMRRWDKDEHVARLEARGFRYTRELLLHGTEPCAAERWVGFALTIGHVPPVLDLGLSDAELGLDALRAAAERTLGARGLPWHVSYRVRVGIK